MKNQYNIIGVMSGTSLDGVDLAHIQFEFINENWNYTIQEAETVSYSVNWIKILKEAINYSESQLLTLNKNYTQLLGEIILKFIAKHSLNQIDAVCSHGHTILHQPNLGYTLQIGNLPEISKIIGQKVVCDFRVQDVELGGQGAPLVPIGDRILFSKYKYCLNLGGFSNVSFEEKNKRIAFDISPVNTVLNFYANKLGFQYDNKGELAESGMLNVSLFNLLNENSYFSKVYPKSLGLEFVHTEVLPVLENNEISTKDILRTYVEHIAFQIARALPEKDKELLITGGGAYNNFLISRIQNYLPFTNIVIPDSKTIEFKEALIFGLLGVLKLRNEINVLSSVTGSKQDHSSGIVYNFLTQ